MLSRLPCDAVRWRDTHLENSALSWHNLAAVRACRNWRDLLCAPPRDYLIAPQVLHSEVSLSVGHDVYDCRCRTLEKLDINGMQQRRMPFLWRIQVGFGRNGLKRCVCIFWCFGADSCIACDPCIAPGCRLPAAVKLSKTLPGILALEQCSCDCV